MNNPFDPFTGFLKSLVFGKDVRDAVRDIRETEALYRSWSSLELNGMRRCLIADRERARSEGKSGAESSIAFCNRRIAIIDAELERRAVR